MEEKPKDVDVIDSRNEGPAVFLLQPVAFNNKVFNFMFDNGCGNFVCRQAALDKLPDECKENIVKGPVIIKGVGDNQVVSQYGHYSVKFPIHTGQYAKFTGVCLDLVTGAMPPYPVREASKTIVDAYVAQGGKASDLPSIPVLVGGETDFLLGIQYNFFQPRLIHILPSGFGIYESLFQGIDGTRGCVGGPHEYFLQCEQQLTEFNHGVNFRTFLARQLDLFNNGLRVCLDHDVLHPSANIAASIQCNSVEKFAEGKAKQSTSSQEGSDVLSEGDNLFDVCNGCGWLCVIKDEENPEREPIVLSLSKIERAIEADQIGKFDYRCVKCRGCTNCKNGERIEMVSLKEEYEQRMIDTSVTVDLDSGVSSATLPFVSDPQEKLSANRNIALKIYEQQLRKLDKNPVERRLFLIQSKSCKMHNMLTMLKI